MAERLFGLETEYGVTGFNARGQPVDRKALLSGLMTLARARYPHLLDGVARGIFLPNGARFYIDYIGRACGPRAVGIPEYATPEVTTPLDAVRHVRAGERILGELLAALPGQVRGLANVVGLRSSVCYAGTGNTLGAHENYLLRRSAAETLQDQLIPHLTSRLIYTGAGGFDNRVRYGLRFTVSPRVCHLVTTASVSSTSDRGIWHYKEEPLARHEDFRSHIQCGETVLSETALYLKVGTTALVVALVDEGLRPGDAVQLTAPLDAMRRFASDPTCRATALTVDGRRVRALDIQRHYLEVAEAHAHASFMPAWAPECCARWRHVLALLADAPAAAATVLDWPCKLKVFKDRAERRGVPWQTVRAWNQIVGQLEQALARQGLADSAEPLEWLAGPSGPLADQAQRLTPMLRERDLTWDGLARFLALRQELFEIDMRFGQLGDGGIHAALDRAGVLNHRVPGVGDVAAAIDEPPPGSRAAVRGRLVRELSGEPGRYLCDWTGIWDCDEARTVDLRDPFATQASWQRWCAPSGEYGATRAHLQRGVRL